MPDDMTVGIAFVIVFTAAALGFVLLPLLGRHVSSASTQNDDSHARRRALEQQKREALAAIKEAEFDLQTGKMTTEDFEFVRRKYAAQAIAAIEELERLSPAAFATEEATGVPPGQHCPGCGGAQPDGARYCFRCGQALTVGTGAAG